MHIDARTGGIVVRPRRHYVWGAIAVLLPVIAIGGGSALFIDTYIESLLPGAMERPLLASYQSQAAQSQVAESVHSVVYVSDAARIESEMAGHPVPLPRPRMASAAVRRD